MLRKSLSSLLALTFFLACGYVNLSFAKDSISWMEADAPPFFIHNGELKGQGYEDLITNIIQEQLPRYEHDMIVANIARHYYNFKHGEKVCTVGFFKNPEREEFAYYSIPSIFTLPIVLIIKKDDLEKLGGKKIVNLNDVLKDENILFGLAKDRSYGEAVDQVIARHRSQKNIFVHAQQGLAQSLFKMLLFDRVDVLLGHPEEAMYMAEQLGARDKIMTLTISENQKSFDGWLSYVACSKNEWGKEVIENINRVLLEQRPTDRYRAAYERWLDDSSLESYRKMYKEHFLTVTK